MIDILVPVLGRPQNVVPLLESVKNTVSEHRVYFICSRTDRKQIRECEKSDAETLIAPFDPGPGDFAKKINWAFAQTTGEWLFQGADDVRFGEKWDLHALATASRMRARVIGTNDLGNPHVKRGLHSTHTLFQRSYIEEYGGTVDGSGRVFSELYDHQWVDNEFIVTATQRHVFAFSKHSIVEHLHPHWGKGTMDATYEKATRATRKDIALYKSRLVLVKNKTRLERRERMAAS